ncbi:hypothetical protein EGW08_016038 [Elysia chlorotica]|uniref:C2H2-type domain-containing protein n=1 Tax=Elysia chlorotica TaxID=188477 RepID=A0A433T3T0_ELYCH|nr:hypothetical protein EGW08_016038 [Elysia chlorotica]
MADEKPCIEILRASVEAYIARERKEAHILTNPEISDDFGGSTLETLVPHTATLKRCGFEPLKSQSANLERPVGSLTYDEDVNFGFGKYSGHFNLSSQEQQGSYTEKENSPLNSGSLTVDETSQISSKRSRFKQKYPRKMVVIECSLLNSCSENDSDVESYLCSHVNLCENSVFGQNSVSDDEETHIDKKVFHHDHEETYIDKKVFHHDWGCELCVTLCNVSRDGTESDEQLLSLKDVSSEQAKSDSVLSETEKIYIENTTPHCNTEMFLTENYTMLGISGALQPFQGGIDEQLFVQKSHLSNDEGAGREKKTFQCNVCLKSFLHRATLYKHKNTHLSHKLFHCDICGKGFSQKGYLLTHNRTHTLEKPFRCDVCGRGFSHSNYLSVHKRTHSGEKPYKCEVCGKSFSQRSSFTGHKRIHTGEKPYQCNECGKRFPQNSYLYSHKRTHQVGRPFKCAKCGREYKQKRHLRAHTLKRCKSVKSVL